MGVLLGHHYKVVRRFTSISGERYYSEACFLGGPNYTLYQIGANIIQDGHHY